MYCWHGDAVLRGLLTSHTDSQVLVLAWQRQFEKSNLNIRYSTAQVLWPYILLYCMKGLAYLLSFAREITFINGKHCLGIIANIHSAVRNLNYHLRCLPIPPQLKACSRKLPSPFRTIAFPPRLSLRPSLSPSFRIIAYSHTNTKRWTST